MLPTTAIQFLKTQLRGQLVLPEDAGYDQARKVYNGLIDKRPAGIVLCRDVADVMTCVNTARDYQLLLAVKGGGHNGGGLGSCDEGLVIDLSLMKGIFVDPVAGTVRVEGGNTLAEIDHATHPFGLAVPAGVFGSTGIGGLALGGGLGYLTRKYGLTIDNLLEASLVLADGRYVQASAESNPDLFWAVRGGGGNFGVVVSFLFRARPVSQVYGGPMMWELSDAKEIMQWYREYIVEAPDDVYGFLALITVPPGPPFPEPYHGKKMCAIGWCYTGELPDAETIFQGIRGFKKPAIDFVGPMPFPVLQSLFDPVYPPGLQWYWKGDYVSELSDEAIDLHLKHAPGAPSWRSVMHLYPINGAAARVPRAATAWNYRETKWAMVISGVDDAAANNKEELVSWASGYWQDMRAFSAGGAYVNFMMQEGNDKVKAAYGDNYARLSLLKSKYDPGNLFRVNQNILPE